MPFSSPKVLLDIEGTVCPICYVKDEMFPYFLRKLPAVLSGFDYPLASCSSSSPLLPILRGFPEASQTSQKQLQAYIEDLVARDVKDTTLKQLQGYIWKEGYDSGELQAPLYSDAISAIKSKGSAQKLYIYSSGSIKAQKLLFGNVKNGTTKEDLNPYFDGYFDTVNAGPKTLPESYTKILEATGSTDEPLKMLFLSDNPKEVAAAQSAGLTSYIVFRPGNAPLTADQRATYKIVDTFDELS